MRVITFDSEAYKAMMRKLERIEAYVKEQKDREAEAKPDPSTVWLNNDEAAQLLDISFRTLQRLRSGGELTYSLRGGRVRYLLSEVQKLLHGHVVKSKYESEEDLLRAHREYQSERRKTNPKPGKKSRKKNTPQDE
jgi:hypothetical protein